MEREKNIIKMVILMFEGEYKNNLRWNGILYEPNNNNIYQLKNG